MVFVKVEYLKANGGTLDTIIVEESLASIDAASDQLIELTSNGVVFLLNYTIIRQVLTEGSGSKVVYEKLQTQTVVVEETPSEINTLINTPSTEPLRYKALLSQNAPVASTNSGTMIAGQIWTLSGTANPSDYPFFDTYELISGTLYAVGSKYRVSVDTAFSFSASSIEYDGSPYVVSTDANGDFNPLINTTGVEPLFPYNGLGDNIATFTGLFANKSKVYHNAKNTTVGGEVNTLIITDDDMGIATLDNTGTPADDILNYTPFEIEVYP